MDKMILEFSDRITRNKMKYALIYSIMHFYFFIVGWTN